MILGHKSNVLNSDGEVPCTGHFSLQMNKFTAKLDTPAFSHP